MSAVIYDQFWNLLLTYSLLCPNVVLSTPFSSTFIQCKAGLEASWNVMAHAQKPDFVFRRNGRVHLNRRGLQFSRILAAELGASAVVMLDTPSSEVVWRVLATHSIRQFPLHFSSRASPFSITFQLASTSPGLFEKRANDFWGGQRGCWLSEDCAHARSQTDQWTDWLLYDQTAERKWQTILAR